MKATGIIRQIDDLGRVVIPREIRRSLKIREGDPLEILIEKNCVCFKKHSTLGSFSEDILRVAQDMAQRTFKHQIAIYDRDSKISGPNSYSSYVDESWEDNSTSFEYEGMGVYPIISDGELYGYICCPESDMSAEMTMIACYLGTAVGD